MSEVLRLHGLGAVVEVRCAGGASDVLLATMRQAWSRCLAPPRPPGGDAGREPVVASPVVVLVNDEEDVPRELMSSTQRITRALIAARAGQLLMVHAGAVADPATGHALVYVAPGGTGKTTLSRHLGQRFGYLTDETVGVDEGGVIHPYPKPLSVRRPEEPRLKDEVSPDVLGLVAAPDRSTVGRVVLLDRAAQKSGVDIEAVGFMDALFALTEQSSSLPRLERPLHRLADLIDSTGPVLRVRYAEASDVEDALIELVRGMP